MNEIQQEKTRLTSSWWISLSGLGTGGVEWRVELQNYKYIVQYLQLISSRQVKITAI